MAITEQEESKLSNPARNNLTTHELANILLKLPDVKIDKQHHVETWTDIDALGVEGVQVGILSI